MLRNTFFILLTIINLNTFANDSQSDLHVSYIFYYKNMAAGTMDLKMRNDNNDFIVSTTYDGNFIASLASKGFREEKVYLKRKDGNLIPKRYTYVDDKESYEVIFEGKRAKIISDSSETISLESRNLIYDPISMLVLLMQNSNYADQAYSVISKKKLKIYDYKFRNDVIYSINGKDFNCYSAEYTSGNKTNYYFFSKDHNNLLISMRIDKNKKEKIRIDLSDIHSLN